MSATNSSYENKEIVGIETVSMVLSVVEIAIAVMQLLLSRINDPMFSASRYNSGMMISFVICGIASLLGSAKLDSTTRAICLWTNIIAAAIFVFHPTSTLVSFGIPILTGVSTLLILLNRHQKTTIYD